MKLFRYSRHNALCALIDERSGILAVVIGGRWADWYWRHVAQIHRVISRFQRALYLRGSTKQLMMWRYSSVYTGGGNENASLQAYCFDRDIWLHMRSAHISSWYSRRMIISSARQSFIVSFYIWCQACQVFINVRLHCVSTGCRRAAGNLISEGCKICQALRMIAAWRLVSLSWKSPVVCVYLYQKISDEGAENIIASLRCASYHYISQA